MELSLDQSDNTFPGRRITASWIQPRVCWSPIARDYEVPEALHELNFNNLEDTAAPTIDDFGVSITDAALSTLAPTYAKPSPPQRTWTYDHDFLSPVSESRSGAAPRYSAQAWREIKPYILKLYLTDKLPLHKVVDRLKHDRGFQATENMCKKRLKDWGISKNTSRRSRVNNIIRTHNFEKQDFWVRREMVPVVENNLLSNEDALKMAQRSNLPYDNYQASQQDQLDIFPELLLTDFDFGSETPVLNEQFVQGFAHG